MREKLVYRSHFQPPPAKKSNADDGLPHTRRGSPYRSNRNRKQLIRNAFRLFCLIIVLIFMGRITGWRIPGLEFGWFRGPGRVKSMQEWRDPYDSMELGLMGLPLSFKLPSGDEIPTVGLGTWKSPQGQVGAAITVSKFPFIIY